MSSWFHLVRDVRLILFPIFAVAVALLLGQEQQGPAD
jgi:hypothetical protein